MDTNNEFEEKDTTEETDAPVTEAPAERSVSPENSAEAEKKTKPDEEGSLLSDIIEIAESTIVTVFVIVMIFTYILHPVNIVGHSMVPTLNKNFDVTQDTDKIFMTTVYFSIDYGDIIVIDENENHLMNEQGEVYVPDQSSVRSLDECIIKRVIACGGQTIDIRDSQVIVDGVVLDEPYIASGSTTVDLGAFEGQYPLTIPEGYYFVMGDNRNRSSDSRDRHVGLISEDQIYGKALVRYSPLSDFKILTSSWKESAND